MAKLSKANTYAILWLNSTGLTADQIMDELGVTDKQVNNVLQQQQPNTPSNTTADMINPKSLMITHTAGKKLNNVSIMTKDASALADEKIRQHQDVPTRDYQRNIFRPNH